MGVFDKVKKILFDEEEVIVTVPSDDLPEKPAKKTAASQGFKNYHENDEPEEDTIKEVIVPKEEEEEMHGITKQVPVINEQPSQRVIFPVDDFDAPIVEEPPRRTQRYEAPAAQPTRQAAYQPQQKEVQKPIMQQEPRKNYRVEPPKPKLYEEKDYKKYLNEDRNKGGKKPFKVTPVISPVYGILDKNYKPDEVVNKAETNPTRERRRSFGPVNYNDDVPTKNSLKADLVELNSTISEMINESVEMKQEVKTEPKVEKKKEVIEFTPTKVITKSIEPEEIAQTIDIEDAFESTNEYETINTYNEEVIVETPEPTIEYDEPEVPAYEEPEEDEVDEPSISLDELIKRNNRSDVEESEEDENLDNTIETDLFNLINSMYSDDEEE